MTCDVPRTDIVTLRSGTARLEVAPRIGGSVLGYWTEEDGTRIDWLSPSATSPIKGFESYRLASFPLVPYSNRIRGGRFDFRGRTIAEPVPPGAAGTIHGHGRSREWRVVDAHEDRLSLDFEHAPDAWPWRYRARQGFILTATSLEVRLAVENLSDDDMPAGLGHHPYFPRTPQARVTAAIASMWQPEAGKFPTQRTEPPPAMDPRRGVVVDQVSLDHAFDGWTGRANIAWPERNATLAMTAAPSLGTLIIFSPPGAAFFCVEPVSHCVDAFNLAAAGVPDTGMRVLKPGELWETWIRLEPQRN